MAELAEEVRVSETLPKITLVDRPVFGDNSFRTHEIDILDVNGNKLGVIKLRKPNEYIVEKGRPREAVIDEMELESPNFELGKAAYLSVLDLLAGIPLRSGVIHDDEFAISIWRSLVKDKLAQENLYQINKDNDIPTFVSIPQPS